MIKKAGILVLLVSLFLGLWVTCPVRAWDGLMVLDSSVQAEFPSGLGFSLSAGSDDDITDIRLHYVVDRAGFATVTSEVYIEFVSGTEVDVAWDWDMRMTGGLPPGSVVDYWWTLEDASGDRVETARTSVRFDDERYSWRNLTEGEVTIYWYEGTLSFARELMATAQQALERLNEDTGAYLEEPVELYIYADARDLRGAMIYPQEWTGGVAFTQYGTIAIGISPGNLDWGKRAISHELAHMVIHQMTSNPYGGLPTWLDEGLAMSAEGPMETEFVYFLNEAIAEDSLISVRSLASPFSAYAGVSYLSYAQSYSIVEFLVDSYGQDKMLQLLNTFRQGSDYDGALERVYGFDMDGLDALWRDYVTGNNEQLTVVTTVMSLQNITKPLIVVVVVLAVVFLLALGLVIERRAWKRGR
jgi:hypothetical protein